MPSKGATATVNATMTMPPKAEGAMTAVNTRLIVPPPPAKRVRKATHAVNTSAGMPSEAEGAIAVMTTNEGLPPPPHPKRAKREPTSTATMPAGGEGQGGSEDQSMTALSATITQLVAAQRERRFCIRLQGMLDRATEQAIASQIGYHPGLPAAERKALFQRASELRRAVEAGETTEALSDFCFAIIRTNAIARGVYDELRTGTERAMRVTAERLPAWPFVRSVAGLGPLGLAVITGEAGDLSNYATVERLWKRLGLAVIEGERQRQRSDPELAKRHGYVPRRRAEMWTLAEALMKHQWRGAKEDEPAHPVGPYGEIYAARKARTEFHPDGWTLLHRERDARRVAFKAVINDLWRAWRAATKTMDPPAAESAAA